LLAYCAQHTIHILGYPTKPLKMVKGGLLPFLIKNKFNVNNTKWRRNIIFYIWK